jgi:hypothetical protein
MNRYGNVKLKISSPCSIVLFHPVVSGQVEQHPAVQLPLVLSLAHFYIPNTKINAKQIHGKSSHPEVRGKLNVRTIFIPSRVR